MSQKAIKQVILRYYKGEEDRVQAIEALDGSVVVNEHLKALIYKSLSEENTGQGHTSTAQPAQVDAEALSKELLPQIRKVVEAAVSSIMAEYTLSPGGGSEAELDEDAQQQIQDGLKKLGQSMM